MSGSSADVSLTTGNFLIVVSQETSTPLMPDSYGRVYLGPEISKSIERLLNVHFTETFLTVTWLNEAVIYPITPEQHSQLRDTLNYLKP
jgi:hypothetical protein